MPKISVILVRTRFPENIGMAARACANMGASRLVLVQPERWVYEKAAPLATGQGRAFLDHIEICSSLGEALKKQTHAFGCTARTGGWRQDVMPPGKAARLINELDAQGETEEGPAVALVFGPEDAGLANSEIELCSHLVTIPTAPETASLNLAQAVLILLYECFTASLRHSYHPEKSPKQRRQSRLSTVEEQEILFTQLQTALQHIEFLPEKNPEWFMRPLRRFLRKAALQRHEFDILMGICRKMLRLSPKNPNEPQTEGKEPSSDSA